MYVFKSRHWQTYNVKLGPAVREISPDTITFDDVKYAEREKLEFVKVLFRRRKYQ